MAILYILFHLGLFMTTNKKTKKKDTKKKAASEKIGVIDVPEFNTPRVNNFARTRIISETLGTLAQFTPRTDGEMGMVPLFSREFLLKNLLGLTDEEFELNERLIERESKAILTTLAELLKDDEEAAPVKKNKKTKVN